MPNNNPSQPLLVATAHIHWDPEFCDVKLIQSMMLFEQLKRITEDSAATFGVRHPSLNLEAEDVQLLLCGDFNSLPNSGVVEYIEKGQIKADHADFKALKYRNTLQKMLSHSANEQFYTHPFKVSYS